MEKFSRATCRAVLAMLDRVQRHPQEGGIWTEELASYPKSKQSILRL